eukprot:1562867-Rhodomonas_salina.1
MDWRGVDYTGVDIAAHARLIPQVRCIPCGCKNIALQSFMPCRSCLHACARVYASHSWVHHCDHIFAQVVVSALRWSLHRTCNTTLAKKTTTAAREASASQTRRNAEASSCWQRA